MNADAHLQGLGVTASNTNAANLAWSRSFNGNGILPTGASVANASATDAVPNTKTNSYALGVAAGTSSTLTFDANGNMTSDGTNSYSYDAENRLLQVTYPGTGNNSQFGYDAFGRNVKIVETVSGSVTSTRQFVWAEGYRREARDASSAVTAQYFALGETISGTSYFFTRDVLGLGPDMAARFEQLKLALNHSNTLYPILSGSVHEMTNSSGSIQYQLAYDPYGQPTTLQGSIVPDFQYAGYYFHGTSGLSLTRTRAYSARFARFINRDILEEDVVSNPFAYVLNNPVRFVDPFGLIQDAPDSATVSSGGPGVTNFDWPPSPPPPYVPNFNYPNQDYPRYPYPSYGQFTKGCHTMSPPTQNPFHSVNPWGGPATGAGKGYPS